jgi:thymidine kinase
MEKLIIVSALNMDFQGNPFGATPEIHKIADQTITLTAKCYKCKKNAQYTKRLTKENAKELIQIGGAEKYQPACTEHFNKQ